MGDEQIDYDEEGYGGAHKLQYQGSGAIPALAEEEIGEDDEYDDLYNDVNVGENFMQVHRPEAPILPASAGNGGFQARNAHESRVETGGSQDPSLPGVSVEAKHSKIAANFPEHEMPVGVKSQEVGSSGYPDKSFASQKGRVTEMTQDAQARNMVHQRSAFPPPNNAVDSSNMVRKLGNEPASVPDLSTGGPRGVPQMPVTQMNVNADVNRPIMNENQIHPPLETGSTMLFVGELHWWTTDAELENVLFQYGRVKEIKFFDERASGKSKGYCQVEFFDAAAAAACKEGMNGHVFNGRACVVAFASPQTIKQMGASYNKTQGQPQNQTLGRRPMNDNVGRGGNMNFQTGDTGRNYGRGGWGRGGGANRGPGAGGPMQGRGVMGAKNMVGNSGNGGGYGPGLIGPGFGGPAAGMIPPRNMMGGGFDPLYMGRGGSYGGFAGPGFPGMFPSFPGANSMGLAGVAPHVNPAFFGRGMAPNGMGMMGTTGMEGPNTGMWSDTNLVGWGEEHGQRTRESSYGGDDGAPDHGYGEVNNEKRVRSGGASRDKERVSERDWSGNSDRRSRDRREHDWDRSERDHKEHRYRDEKDSYQEHRKRDRDSGYEEDWDRVQSSTRPRSRSRAVPEEDHRTRSRDTEYGKRRRLPSE